MSVRRKDDPIWACLGIGESDWLPLVPVFGELALCCGYLRVMFNKEAWFHRFGILKRVRLKTPTISAMASMTIQLIEVLVKPIDPLLYYICKYCIRLTFTSHDVIAANAIHCPHGLTECWYYLTSKPMMFLSVSRRRSSETFQGEEGSTHCHGIRGGHSRVWLQDAGCIPLCDGWKPVGPHVV